MSGERGAGSGERNWRVTFLVEFYGLAQPAGWLNLTVVRGGGGGFLLGASGGMAVRRDVQVGGGQGKNRSPWQAGARRIVDLQREARVAEQVEDTGPIALPSGARSSSAFTGLFSRRGSGKPLHRQEGTNDMLSFPVGSAASCPAGTAALVFPSSHRALRQEPLWSSRVFVGHGRRQCGMGKSTRLAEQHLPRAKAMATDCYHRPRGVQKLGHVPRPLHLEIHLAESSMYHACCAVLDETCQDERYIARDRGNDIADTAASVSTSRERLVQHG